MHFNEAAKVLKKELDLDQIRSLRDNGKIIVRGENSYFLLPSIEDILEKILELERIKSLDVYRGEGPYYLEKTLKRLDDKEDEFPGILSYKNLLLLYGNGPKENVALQVSRELRNLYEKVQSSKRKDRKELEKEFEAKLAEWKKKLSYKDKLPKLSAFESVVDPFIFPYVEIEISDDEEECDVYCGVEIKKNKINKLDLDPYQEGLKVENCQKAIEQLKTTGVYNVLQEVGINHIVVGMDTINLFAYGDTSAGGIQFEFTLDKNVNEKEI